MKVVENTKVVVARNEQWRRGRWQRRAMYGLLLVALALMAYVIVRRWTDFYRKGKNARRKSKI